MLASPPPALPPPSFVLHFVLVSCFLGGGAGLARKLESSILAATTVGTPYHLSPEICKGLPYDGSSDVWAFGCIVHEISCLDYPFKGASLPQVVARIMKGIAGPRAAWREK